MDHTSTEVMWWADILSDASHKYFNMFPVFYPTYKYRYLEFKVKNALFFFCSNKKTHRHFRWINSHHFVWCFQKLPNKGPSKSNANNSCFIHQLSISEIRLFEISKKWSVKKKKKQAIFPECLQSLCMEQCMYLFKNASLNEIRKPECGCLFQPAIRVKLHHHTSWDLSWSGTTTIVVDLWMQSWSDHSVIFFFPSSGDTSEWLHTPC